MTADIRIYVSCRIDVDSFLIDNPLYIPVRCGAVFDTSPIPGLAGDDSGDNISRLRNSYSEFTVQYWAWKNQMADWIGLCHYRRFLAFAGEKGKRDGFNMLHEVFLSEKKAKKYGLYDSEYMAELIRDNDAVVSEYAPVNNVVSPKGHVNSVRELWEAHEGLFIDRDTIPIMLRCIDEMAMEYSESAREYLDSPMHRGFNCYILKRELFDRMCRFQFPIMKAIAEAYEPLQYTGNMARIPGYVGEMLYGIFIYHISEKEDWKIATRPLVLFETTEKVQGVAAIIKRYFRYGLFRFFKYISMPVFPLGSGRREWLKQLLKKS